MKRKTILKSLTLAVGMMALIVELLVNAHAQNIKQGVADKLDRTVLPVPEPQPPTITELDARNVKPPARFQVTAPKGAPNVVIVLLDDIGFGNPALLVDRSRCPHSTNWQPTVCAITVFIPPRSVRLL